MLIFAKYITVCEKSPVIKKEYFDAAFQCLNKFLNQNSEPDISELKKIIGNFHLTSYKLAMKYSPDVTQATLAKIANAPTLPFSNELDKLLEQAAQPSNLEDWINNSLFYHVPKNRSIYRKKLADLEQAKEQLLSEVYGQDHVIEELIDCIATSQWRHRRNKPKGIFLFAGPPASGKTYLAECFANNFSGSYAFKKFDMTHYTNSNESFGLVGSKKTYDDSSPGQLTTFVKENPKSVIVFDEFEKAHTQVLLSMLGMLSSGYVQDQFTEDDVDFRETIVIFTSNLGRSVYNKSDYINTLDTNLSKARAVLIEQFRKETKIERDREVKAIPSELLSRLSQGSVLLFKTLGFDELIKVTEQHLTSDLEAFSELSDIKVNLDIRPIAEVLLLSFAPSFDIRDIKENISGKVIDPISDYLRQYSENDIEVVNISLCSELTELLSKSNCQAIFDALKKRNEIFSFQSVCKDQNKTIELQFSKPIREMIIHAEDVEPNGGIVLELPSFKFSDIAGHHTVKQHLNETINVLNNRELLLKSGITPPKGMILYGPPGTGKTTLARALASEAQLPFLSCAGNELLGRTFIEQLFERARKYAPCILFIDELDALPKRGEAGALADALVNRLLVEIDGFNLSEEPIFVIAATNRLDKIDPALLRSGRLDLQVEVPYLDKDARRWFIHRFLKNQCYETNIDAEVIVSLSSGLSGADLEKIHRESVLRSIASGNKTINQAELIEQVNILKYGTKRSQKSCEKALQETAYHEAGHAVLSNLLIPERKIDHISVIPRGDSQGMVAYNSEQNQNIDYTKNYWFSLTCVALAGRSAQVKRFAEEGLDTGASSDLREAMRCAFLATSQYGMHEDSYNINIAALQQWTDQSYFREKAEKLIEDWITKATEKTDLIVATYWETISLVAETLLRKECLSERELIELIAFKDNEGKHTLCATT